MRLKLTLIACLAIIGTMILLDNGPSAQEEAEDMAAVAIPPAYAQVKATTDAAAAVLAERIAEAYRQGKADAMRDGCKRKIISKPL